MKKDDEMRLPHSVILRVMGEMVEGLKAAEPHLDKPFYTVTELAALTGLSTSKITDLFQEEPGVNRHTGQLRIPRRVFLRVLGRTTDALRKLETNEKDPR
jgi:AraC-like DNA-binding protein